MAIAIGNSTSGQSSSSATSYTLAHNLSAASGNNRLLVLGVSLDLTTGPPTLSCTYNGVAMTALTAAYYSGMQVRLFYLLDADLPASAGSYNIVASTTNAGYLKIIASDFTGVDQAAADMEDTSTANSNTLSTQPDPVVANSLTWDMKANASSSQNWNSHDADYTQIAELEGGSAHASTASYRIHAGTDADTCTDGGTQTANMAGACAVFAPYVSAGTPHPYTGTGFLSLDSNVLKARGKNPSVSGAFSFNSGVATKLAKLYVFASGGVRVYDSGSVTSLTVVEPANEYDYAADAVMVYADGSVLSKGKAFVSIGSIYYVANPVLAKGKTPAVGGSIAFDAGAITERVKLWIYPGNGAQVYASDADVSSTSSVSRTYVGEGVLVFDSGVEVAIGKVFTGDGLFHFSAGTISVASAQVSYSYTGLNSGAVVYDNVTVYLRTYGTARHKESLPVRPSSQDGAWTDGVSDGAWTEEYVHGAYTDIGYDKEAKPFTRFTQTKEGVPDASYTAEGSGVLVEEGALGILAEPGSLGVLDTYVRTLEGKPTWSGSDESAPLGTYTLEAKPTA